MGQGRRVCVRLYCEVKLQRTGLEQQGCKWKNDEIPLKVSFDSETGILCNFVKNLVSNIC